MMKTFNPGTKVVRVGEPDGPIGTVSETHWSGAFVYVSFSHLAPMWVRASHLEKVSVN